MRIQVLMLYLVGLICDLFLKIGYYLGVWVSLFVQELNFQGDFKYKYLLNYRKISFV